jgi:hypothetical protein
MSKPIFSDLYPCDRKKDKISIDVTTTRVIGNCNSITEIIEGKIYSNCQNLNV